MNGQLLHEAEPVVVHGLGADDQQASDLLVAISFGDELEDLRFTEGQDGRLGCSALAVRDSPRH